MYLNLCGHEDQYGETSRALPLFCGPGVGREGGWGEPRSKAQALTLKGEQRQELGGTPHTVGMGQ